ncbi:MAG: glycosyltransferase [Rhodobacteraceae bacterium]|nr:glycosyltransferase [Paracoccaceae bacterium]
MNGTMPRLFIQASNIHQGGGRVLLLGLLENVPPDLPCTVFLDQRMPIPEGLSTHINIKQIRPTILARLNVEFKLSRQVTAKDYVICFGNLPPLLEVAGTVTLFLQNRYLVDPDAPLGALPWKARLRLRIEKRWLKLKQNKASSVIVQTRTMRRLAEGTLRRSVECAMFVPEMMALPENSTEDTTSRKFDFLYVASGEAHKNHQNLISAWKLLAGDGLFPSLVLTLNPEKEATLVAQINEASVSHKLNIHNLGQRPHEALFKLYREAGALIYPSCFESLGLPLLEARSSGLPVIAPELDYVRDIIAPVETFDPNSALSIARAVKRHLRKEQDIATPIDVETFLARATQKENP